MAIDYKQAGKDAYEKYSGRKYDPKKNLREAPDPAPTPPPAPAPTPPPAPAPVEVTRPADQAEAARKQMQNATYNGKAVREVRPGVYVDSTGKLIPTTGRGGWGVAAGNSASAAIKNGYSPDAYAQLSNRQQQEVDQFYRDHPPIKPGVYGNTQNNLVVYRGKPAQTAGEELARLKEQNAVFAYKHTPTPLPATPAPNFQPADGSAPTYVPPPQNIKTTQGVWEPNGNRNSISGRNDLRTGNMARPGNASGISSLQGNNQTYQSFPPNSISEAPRTPFLDSGTSLAQKYGVTLKQGEYNPSTGQPYGGPDAAAAIVVLPVAAGMGFVRGFVAPIRDPKGFLRGMKDSLFSPIQTTEGVVKSFAENPAGVAGELYGTGKFFESASAANPVRVSSETITIPTEGSAPGPSTYGLVARIGDTEIASFKLKPEAAAGVQAVAAEARQTAGDLRSGFSGVNEGMRETFIEPTGTISKSIVGDMNAALVEPSVQRILFEAKETGGDLRLGMAGVKEGGYETFVEPIGAIGAQFGRDVSGASSPLVEPSVQAIRFVGKEAAQTGSDLRLGMVGVKEGATETFIEPTGTISKSIVGDMNAALVEPSVQRILFEAKETGGDLRSGFQGTKEGVLQTFVGPSRDVAGSIGRDMKASFINPDSNLALSLSTIKPRGPTPLDEYGAIKTLGNTPEEAATAPSVDTYNLYGLRTKGGRSLTLFSTTPDGAQVFGSPDITPSLKNAPATATQGDLLRIGGALETAAVEKAFKRLQEGEVVSAARAKYYIETTQQILRDQQGKQSAYLRNFPTQTERLGPEGVKLILERAKERNAIVSGSFSRGAQLAPVIEKGGFSYELTKVPNDIDVHLNYPAEQIQSFIQQDVKALQQKGIDARVVDDAGKNAIEVRQPSGEYAKAAEYLNDAEISPLRGEEPIGEFVLGIQKPGKPMLIEGVKTTTLSEELRGVAQGTARVRKTAEGKLDIYPPEKRVKDIGSVSVSARTLYQSDARQLAQPLKNIETFESFYPDELVNSQIKKIEPNEKVILADYSKSPAKTASVKTPLFSIATSSETTISPSTSPLSDSPPFVSGIPSISTSTSPSDTSSGSPSFSESPSSSPTSESPSPSISPLPSDISTSPITSDSPSVSPSSSVSESPSLSSSVSFSPSSSPSPSPSYSYFPIGSDTRSPGSPKKRRKDDEQMFQVEGRRHGKFQTLSFQGMRLSEAVDFAEQFADNTLAASVRITENGRPIQGSTLKEAAGMFDKLKFSPSKNDAGIFVEKPSERLSTFGEKSEIHAAKGVFSQTHKSPFSTKPGRSAFL